MSIVSGEVIALIRNFHRERPEAESSDLGITLSEEFHDGHGYVKTITLDETVGGLYDQVMLTNSLAGTVIGLNTGAGHDAFYGGAANEVVYLGDGHDFASGGLGRDRLYGEDGDDILSGGPLSAATLKTMLTS